MWCGCCLLIFYTIRALLGIGHLYLMNRFAQMRYHMFASRFFEHYLQFSLHDFVAKNSATVAQIIFSCSGNLAQVFSSLLIVATEVLTIACIYTMLFIASWKMTLGLSCILGCMTLFIVLFFSKTVTQSGKQNQQHDLASRRIFNETFWNFKLIKLLSNQKVMTNRFSQATLGVSRTNTLNMTLQSAPRFVLETIGFLVLISMILIIIYRLHDARAVMPFISLYALAFYRLLPSVNKILASYNQITFCRPALRQLLDYVASDIEQIGDSEVLFSKSITVQGVSFWYHHDKPIIHTADLIINKGERVAFIGESGSGKSTLLDIIMGVYQPYSGSMIIDNQTLDATNIKAWRRKIGYIPQSIYLFDGTVADNIVFGRLYDEHKIIQVLRNAHIYDFLCSHEGLQTIVGEGGVKLSGGQKQRIAIARALYADPEVLVLDEATSALDQENEHKIMDEIYEVGKDKTLLVVAHRLSTIQRCEKVYKLEQGTIIPWQHTYINPHTSEQTANR